MQRTTGKTLREASSSKDPADSKKEKGTQSHTDNKEVGSSPASSKEHRPTSTLTFCLVTSNLQNNETAHGHCFKSLILWYFATAAIEKDYVLRVALPHQK